MGFSPDVFVPEFRTGLPGPDGRGPGQDEPGVQIYVRVAPGTTPEAARSRAEAAAVQLDRDLAG